jgi:hypothetical protein
MESSTTTEYRPIRLRAPLIGLLLAVGICLLTPYNNIYLRATPLGGGHFPLAPFVIFLFLAILISLISRIFRSSLLLTGSELLVIWIEMVIGSGIAYTGFARTFLINLTTPEHFATIGNRWEEVLHPLIPPALTPSSSEAVKLLYNGLPGGRDMGWLEVVVSIPWDAWLSPLLLWGALILLAYLVMLFLINIISRQWIHNERMNFPLLKVPEMIGKAVSEGKTGSFFFNRFLLTGLSLPVFLHLINGLNVYYPTIPSIPTLFLAGSYFSESGLLVGFQKLKIYIYPAFIGFAFLASRQIHFLSGSFSYVAASFMACSTFLVIRSRFRN